MVNVRYLDPKNDLTFKKVFGEHPKLLRAFLNAMLPLEEGRAIVDLSYLPEELVPDIPILKNTIVDVRCTDNAGRIFIVEMQVLWTDSFMQRVLFNASKAYVKQLRKGQEYKYLQPVYSLNLVDDLFETDNPEYYHHYQIVNLADSRKQLKGLEFIFIELPKFNPETLHEKKLRALWLRFLTEISEDTGAVPQELIENPEISEALGMLRESAFSPEELDAYEKYWDQVSVERTRLADAMSKGLEEGRAEGRFSEKIKIARAMKEKGLDAATIEAVTGLSLDAIRAL
jgi:predicted transposase/invertase (TIGR01784 family)